MVMRARHGEVAVARMWGFLQVENDFEIVPFDEAQAREALSAFGRYGKGIDPRARLNLSDVRRTRSPGPRSHPCYSRVGILPQRTWPPFYNFPAYRISPSCDGHCQLSSTASPNSPADSASQCQKSPAKLRGTATS